MIEDSPNHGTISRSLVNIPSLTPELLIREPDLIAELCRQRGCQLDIPAFAQAEKDRRKQLIKIQEMRATFKAKSKTYRTLTKEQQCGLRKLGLKIETAEIKLNALTNVAANQFSQIPNFVAPDVPIGSSQASCILRKSGTPRVFDFVPLGHLAVLQKACALKLDKELSDAGYAWYSVKGSYYFLRQALSWIYLQRLSDRSFEISTVPLVSCMSSDDSVELVVNRRQDSNRIDGEKLALNIDGAQSLLSQHRNEILGSASLPRKYATNLECFNAAFEMNKSCKDRFSNGQYGKIEQLVICRFEESESWQNYIRESHEMLFEELNIPYRVVLCATKSMRQADFRKITIESWMPSIARYQELASITFYRDFQSRRSNIRSKNYDDDGATFFPCTVAANVYSDRLFAAIVENYQLKDGGIEVPTILRPLLRKEII